MLSQEEKRKIILYKKTNKGNSSTKETESVRNHIASDEISRKEELKEAMLRVWASLGIPSKEEEEAIIAYKEVN